MMSQPLTYCLFGLPLHAVTELRAIRLIRDAIGNRQRLFLTTPNLNFVICCQNSAEFRESVIDSDLVVADGMPLVWAARLLGLPIRERVAGSNIFERLCFDAMDHMAEPIKVFFFGGPEGAGESACRRLNADANGAICVGHMSPGFGSIESMSSSEVINVINASQADFLVVSLGAVKGQAWIQHNRNRLSVPVISHLGAVVNFAAGTIQRAPRWMQATGLEWLWRIKEEPKLIRRYLSDGLGLIRLLFRCVLPCWLNERWKAVSENEYRCAHHSLNKNIEGVTLSLYGAWGAANRDRLNCLLKQQMNVKGPLCIDLSAVSYVDSAVFGEIMSLMNSRRALHSKFAFAPVGQNVRRYFEWYGVSHLLGSCA